MIMIASVHTLKAVVVVVCAEFSKPRRDHDQDRSDYEMTGAESHLLLYKYRLVNLKLSWLASDLL